MARAGEPTIMQRESDLQPTVKLLLFGGIIAVILLYEFIFMPSTGYDHNFGYLYGRDFANFWAGGLAAVQGKVAILTDVDGYNMWLNGLLGHGVGVSTHFVFSYPPNILPLLMPFGFMGYATALYVYTAASLVLAAVLGWWLAGKDRIGALLMVLSPGLMATIFNGHPGMLLAGLLVPGMLLLERRPILAGVLLGLATIKPQLGLLIAVIMLIRFEWRAILAALCSASALILLSLALFGREPWIAYFSIIAPRQVEVLHVIYDENFFYFLPTPFALFNWMGFSFAWAQGLQAVCSVLAASASIYIWLTCRDLGARVLAVFIGTTLILPYFNNYDFTMLALAQVVFLYHSPSALRLGQPLHLGLWTVAALSPPIAVLGPQIGALPLAAGLAGLVVLARRGAFDYIE